MRHKSAATSRLLPTIVLCMASSRPGVLAQHVEALRPQRDRVARPAGPHDLGDVGEAPLAHVAVEQHVPAQRACHVRAQQGPGTGKREPAAAEILAHAQRAARAQQPEQLELIQPQPLRQLAGVGRAAGQRFRDLKLRQGSQYVDRPEAVDQLLDTGGCGIIRSHAGSA